MPDVASHPLPALLKIHPFKCESPPEPLSYKHPE